MVDAPRWIPLARRGHGLRCALLALMWALMWVQTVGVLHRVAHVPQSTGIAAHAAIGTSGSLAAIWGEHSNSAECQLFDHACPDVLHVAVWALPTTSLVRIWVAVVLHERFALFERFYAARGPPVVLI